MSHGAAGLLASFTVAGRPAPQGSKTMLPDGGFRESSRRVPGFRRAVAGQAAQAWNRDRYAGPVELSVVFTIARPRAHYGTGRNADTIKRDAPWYPTARTIGDLDKLVRAVCDGLVAGGVLADDSLVVSIDATKLYGRANSTRIELAIAAEFAPDSLLVDVQLEPVEGVNA